MYFSVSIGTLTTVSPPSSAMRASTLSKSDIAVGASLFGGDSMISTGLATCHDADVVWVVPEEGNQSDRGGRYTP